MPRSPGAIPGGRALIMAIQVSAFAFGRALEAQLRNVKENAPA